MIEHGERVYVYRNSVRRLWSVKSATSYRIIASTPVVYLSDCEFRVSAKGRERVRREKVKNVHAGVYGHWINNWFDKPPEMWRHLWRQITYNPYENETFIWMDTGEPVLKATHAAFLAMGGVWATEYEGAVHDR